MLKLLTAVEHAKVVEQLQDLQARHGQLITDCNMVKLQHRVGLGRAPTMEEFEQLTGPLQKHWTRIYPEELQQYALKKDTRTGKYMCGYVFSDGVSCGRSYSKKAAAKQCRIYCRIEAQKFARINGTPADEHVANQEVSEYDTPEDFDFDSEPMHAAGALNQTRRI